MIILVSFIVFIISAAAVVMIVYKKMPALAELPHDGHHGFKKPEVVAKLQKKITEHHFHFFKKQMLLHKILSKTRILILKLERRIDVMLHGIRKNAQELDKKMRPKRKAE